MMVQYFWYIEISPVVSHKIFKIFYIDILENKPHPLVTMFSKESWWLEQSW